MYLLLNYSVPDANKSSSCDSLYQISLKDLAGKKADYSHIQSKVRQYIYSGNNSISQKSQDDDDLYGKSFVLSPGRKSLSMSNLVQDLDSKNTSRRASIKSFLSSKNLDDLQVQVRSRASTFSKSRDSVLTATNYDKVSRLLHHSRYYYFYYVKICLISKKLSSYTRGQNDTHTRFTS